MRVALLIAMCLLVGADLAFAQNTKETSMKAEKLLQGWWDKTPLVVEHTLPRELHYVIGVNPSKVFVTRSNKEATPHTWSLRLQMPLPLDNYIINVEAVVIDTWARTFVLKDRGSDITLPLHIEGETLFGYFEGIDKVARKIIIKPAEKAK